MDSPLSASRKSVMKGKLRNIFSPKPKLPPAPPVISLPSRMPVRRKREFREVTPDENDSATAADTRAQSRQRLASESTASIDTIRSPTPPDVSRPRTMSNETIKSVSAIPAKKVGDKNPPGAPPTVPSSKLTKAAPIQAALSRTTAHNHTNTTRPKIETNVAPFPSIDEAEFEFDDESHTNANGNLCHSSVGSPPNRRRSLTRTVSFRDYALEPDEDEFQMPPVAIKVLEASDEEPSDELSPEDEAVVREIISSIVHGDSDSDAEDKARFCKLVRESSPLRRRSPSDSGFSSVLDSDDDAPGLPTSPSRYHESGATAVSFTNEFYDKTVLGRFDVDIKPKYRNSVMWDVSLHDVYAWPGLLYITDSKPSAMLLPRNPVQLIEIEWRTVDRSHWPGEISTDDDPDYTTSYQGKALKRSHIVKHMNPLLGIYTEPSWSYLSPDRPNTGPGGAWALRFWVPVPMSLFKGRESRTFRLRARVTFGDWDLPRVVGHSGAIDVSIEHLHRAREMGGAPKA